MDTYVSRIWLWCAVSLLILVGLRYLPEWKLWDYELRPVDLFADVLLPEKTPVGEGAWAAASSTAASGIAAGRTADAGAGKGLPESSGSGAWAEAGQFGSESAVPAGYGGSAPLTKDGLAMPVAPVAIEDFGFREPAMARFYRALSQIPETGRSVHVAVFGDSFIEGDLMTDRLRDTLQTVFGGSGVGFVPLASPSNHSRTTIIQQSSGFSHRTAIDTGRTGRGFAIAGYMAIPTAESNVVSYYGIKNSEDLQWFDRVTLFYQSSRGSNFSFQGSRIRPGSARLPGGKGLQAYTLSLDSSRNVRFSFPMDSSLRLHGLSFTSGTGVYVDNFSLRGNSGHALFRSSTDLLRQSDSLLNYKLIVVQYGLNVLSRGQTDYGYYAVTLKRVINHLKQGFPGSSILIVGVGDRSEQLSGRYGTMRGLHALMAIQRQVAVETGVAFWNLHKAMGGDGSMARFVEHEPALANKDHTHINRKGGAVIAGQLAKALLHGYSHY